MPSSFACFIVGWRQAFQSEWPYIIMISIINLLLLWHASCLIFENILTSRAARGAGTVCLYGHPSEVVGVDTKPPPPSHMPGVHSVSCHTFEANSMAKPQLCSEIQSVLLNASL